MLAYCLFSGQQFGIKLRSSKKEALLFAARFRVKGQLLGENKMNLTNPSSALHNEDLAPATELKWGAVSFFNVWTSDVPNLWGYYLAARLFLLCGSFINFVIAIGIGSLMIFVLMSLVGNADVRTYCTRQVNQELSHF